MVAATLLCVTTAAPIAQAQPTFRNLTPEANTSGDQLVFFYDARPNRTTFLTVGNTTGAGVVLEVAFFSQTLQRVAEQVFVLPTGGAKVIDPTAISGVPTTAGLAFVTPIMSEVNHTPVVPNRPLVGGFTIVNTALGSGTGGNPFGRMAVPIATLNSQVPRGAPGAVVDGVALFYQLILPTARADGKPSLTLPVYFNPATLAPPDQDGNRLFFASFVDQYAAPVGPNGEARFNIGPVLVPVTAQASFFGATDGLLIATVPVAVPGVRFDSLQGISNGVALTSSGRLEILFPGRSGVYENFFGMASQSLGTFAVGQPFVPIDFP